jgi:hypothetical protein
MSTNQPETGFKELLNSMMKRRWLISAIVLGGFMLIIAGIFAAIMNNTSMSNEWKELLLLLLGAFIGSYGKIIDYWFSDTDKDKMLVQKMDEEDGLSLSNTNDMKESPKNTTPIVPEAFINAASKPSTDTVTDPQIKTWESPIHQESASSGLKIEIDSDGDGVADGYDTDGDGDIDEFFPHRYCQHIWGDSNQDGHEECQECGLLRGDVIE